ncbi:MAG: hypothetical protein SFY67_15970 [Candidatus Melainabacteria bacterium]|nr:hypothetical protein [Candidatus Melainabacteria bacterium]
MAQAEAAQETEHQPAADTGHNFLPDASDISSLFVRMAESIKTDFGDFTGIRKTNDTQTLTRNLVNGTGSFESVMQNIDSLKAQGKLSEFSSEFTKTYGTDFREQLVQNYPGRDVEIDKVLGTSSTDKPADPMLGGLSRDQLKTILAKFPELEGVIKDPAVLGAMVQNEKDHTYDDFHGHKLLYYDDSLIDNTFRRLNRKYGDRTEWMSQLNPDQLRAKAEKSGGILGFLYDKAAKLQDRVLSISIGDGQMQVRNIIALQQQERAAGRDVPTISSSLTPEGSAQLVGAYFAKSVQMLTDHTIEDPKQNPFMRNNKAVRDGFKEAQRLWDTGDPELKLRAVMMTYNPGISNSDPTKWNPEHILKHYLGK